MFVGNFGAFLAYKQIRSSKNKSFVPNSLCRHATSKLLSLWAAFPFLTERERRGSWRQSLSDAVNPGDSARFSGDLQRIPHALTLFGSLSQEDQTISLRGKDEGRAQGDRDKRQSAVFCGFLRFSVVSRNLRLM